ncbi:hypothetical protein EDB19DRAFT_1827907 [Suillus lakei]|nr:hypothetical protein EDB19DRAFT_1827907 [Suillus lakei]
MCAQNSFLLPLERMQMEQSADDVRVAAAWNLRYSALSGAGCVLGRLVPIYSRLPFNIFIQIYDYVYSLHGQWTFLLRSRWTKKCRTLINICSCFTAISLCCSECIFLLRIYALWNNDRIVLVTMMSTLFATIVPFIGIWFTAVAASGVMASAIPGIQGCYLSSRSSLLFMSFILVFVFQPGLISLTLIRVLQSWRSDNGPLYAILVKHNIFYYACGLFLSAMNVLVPILSSDPTYTTFLETLQVFVLSILATRMHLHLWNIDQHMHGSDALVYMSMSGMSPADRALRQQGGIGIGAKLNCPVWIRAPPPPPEERPDDVSVKGIVL